MKKTLSLLGFILVFIIALLVPNQVEAATTVSTESELIQALSDGETDITLSANIELTDTIQINNTVSIDGGNKTITTKEGVSLKKSFEIYNGVVNFEKITIKNSYSGGRCIDVRTGNVTLNLDNVTLITTGSGNNQTLTIGGNFSTAIDVYIKNSTFEAGKAGYAIITFNPVNLTIDNSNITGYAALYMKGVNESAGSAGSVVNIINGSTLNGKNDNSGMSDDFGTIVMEDENITVNIENSTIQATGVGSASQQVFSEGNVDNSTQGNEINVKEGSTIQAKEVGEISSTLNSNTTVTIDSGVKTNIEIPENYLQSGTTLEKDENGDLVKDENGNYVVVLVTTYKVTIDGVEYSVESGKTVADITEYQNIIKKEGYDFVGFQTADGKEWIVTTKVDSDVVLKTVFKKTEVASRDTGENDDDEDEQDETPTTGVESIALPVFTTIAVISLAGIVATRKRK